MEAVLSGSTETDEDVLIECVGGCGKKILRFFSVFSGAAEVSAAHLCLECRSKPLKVETVH